MTHQFKAILPGLLACCLSGACAMPAGNPIDQLPMYGGVDRWVHQNIADTDRIFSEKMVQQFGSREAAAAHQADYAFRLYQSDNYAKAMRRFNQAWLLDPENADVYAFAEAAGFEPKRVYLDDQRVRALYEQEHYATGWEIIERPRETGSTPDPELTRALAEKMPDPSK